MTWVIAWENNQLPGGRKSIRPATMFIPERTHYWTGHAAMLIGDRWDDKGSYVGWNPAGETSFVDDINGQGYLPDHVYRYPEDDDEIILNMQAK